MVGLTNLELESMLKKSTADQVAFQEDTTKRFQKLSKDLVKLAERAERTDNSIQELTEKTKLTFNELLHRANKTDNALSHILQQLSFMANAKTSENPATSSLHPIITSTQEAPPLDKGKQRQQVSTSNQEAPSSSVAVPKKEPLIPKVSGEFPPSTQTESRGYNNSSSTQTQIFNAPPTAVNNKFLADRTINLKSIPTKAEQPPQMIRFLDTIEQYNVRILYQPGKANIFADLFSRSTDSAFPLLE